MRHMITLRFIAAMFVASVLTSCGDKVPTDHNHVVLLDLSGSAAKDLPSNLADVEAKLLRSLGPKDRLTVLAIDDASESWAQPLFQLDLGAEDFVQPQLPSTIRSTVADQDRAAHLDSAASSFVATVQQRAVSRSASGGLTDIFGALTKANDHAHPNMLNHLWVLCDMEHEDASINFRKACATGSDLKEFLPKAPVLEVKFGDVHVFTGNNSLMGKRKFEAITAFWNAYFKQQKVPVITYTSGGMREVSLSLSASN